MPPAEWPRRSVPQKEPQVRPLGSEECQIRRRTGLFENSVSASKKRSRHIQSQPFCGPQVDRQFKLDRRLDRQFTWFGTPENAIHIGRNLMKQLFNTGSIGEQTALGRSHIEWIDRRNSIASRKLDDSRTMSRHEAVRHHDETRTRFAGNCSDRRVDVGIAPNRSDERCNRKGLGSGFERAIKECSTVRSCIGIEQPCRPHDPRIDFFEKSKPLSSHRGLKVREASDVASGPRQVFDETLTNRIRNDCEHYRYASSFSLRCCGGGRGGGHDYIRLPGDQLPCEAPDALSIGATPANLDVHVATVRPPKLPQTLLKRFETSTPRGVSLGIQHE